MRDWPGDARLAWDVAVDYARKRGLEVEEDLAVAYVSSGVDPGFMLIANTPAASKHTASIMKTVHGEIFVWQDEVEA